MRPRILCLAAACAILCVLAACPAQAHQTALHKRVAAAYEARAETQEAEAAAFEASIFARVAWNVVGESGADDSLLREMESEGREGAHELASELRQRARTVRMLVSRVREGAGVGFGDAAEWRELDSITQEAVSRLRDNATLRAFVVEMEGNMMLAQANATGRYAALWERAAEARGVERTA